MISQKVIIQNPTGLHLRPAGILCTEAIKYKSKISIRHNNQTFNAKSVLSVLGAGVKKGYELEFICEGEDEKEAMDAIMELVEHGLGD